MTNIVGPTTQWRCDHCGEMIHDPSEAAVSWETGNADRGEIDWRISHLQPCMDRIEAQTKTHRSWQHIDYFMGHDGLTKLLEHLAYGPLLLARSRRLEPMRATTQIGDHENFVDLIRRIHTPNYEAARQHFGNADVRDLTNEDNAAQSYLQDSLAEIVRVGTDRS